jgi:hypothetical protein
MSKTTPYSSNYLSETNTTFEPDFNQGQSFTPEIENTTQPANFTCYWRYRDPNRSYKAAPAQCRTVTFVCPLGTRYFGDECGCGCVRTGSPNPGPAPRPILRCPNTPVCGVSSDGRRGNFPTLCAACSNPFTVGYTQGSCRS